MTSQFKWKLWYKWVKKKINTKDRKESGDDEDNEEKRACGWWSEKIETEKRKDVWRMGRIFENSKYLTPTFAYEKSLTEPGRLLVRWLHKAQRRKRKHLIIQDQSWNWGSTYKRFVLQKPCSHLNIWISDRDLRILLLYPEGYKSWTYYEKHTFLSEFVHCFARNKKSRAAMAIRSC